MLYPFESFDLAGGKSQVLIQKEKACSIFQGNGNGMTVT